MKKNDVVLYTGSDKFFGLSPLDLASVFYILFTAIYICFGASHLENISEHMIIRGLLLTVIFLISYLHLNYPNKLIFFFKNLYPLLFLSFFYSETNYMKNIIFTNDLDKTISDIEFNLFGCQPSIEFARKMPQLWFKELMNLCYFSYYVINSSYCIIIYFKNRAQSYRDIFIVIFSFYLFYIFFAIVPSVGPQYFIGPPDHDKPYLFGKIMEYILTTAEKPTGAFPSSHVGISLIALYLTFKHQKTLFYVFLPFVIGICFATVYLREHYLIDVIIGFISAPILLIISGFVYDKLNLLALKQIESKN